MRSVYLTTTGLHMPGPAIANDKMADYLGLIDARSAKFRDFVLRQNGIKSRHYAIDELQNLTISNAGMAAAALQNALDTADIEVSTLQSLSAATTLPDLIVPGHASAVHAELGGGPLDLASFQSVCASAMMAIKNAWMNVACQQVDFAAATGSDLPSVRFRASLYEPAAEILTDSTVRMSAEFLRWTLSDGAGAAVFEPTPRGPLCYKVDAIRTRSFAHKFDTCMYAGIAPDKKSDLTKAWSTHPDGAKGAASDGALMLLQDMALLKNIFHVWADEVRDLQDAAFFDASSLDWFLCHYSAESLRDEFAELLHKRGIDIPLEKWWSNLSFRGNTGAASVFLLLHDFLKSGQAKEGDRIYCMVPESGRALMSSMFLTVVAP